MPSDDEPSIRIGMRVQLERPNGTETTPPPKRKTLDDDPFVSHSRKTTSTNPRKLCRQRDYKTGDATRRQMEKVRRADATRLCTGPLSKTRKKT